MNPVTQPSGLPQLALSQSFQQGVCQDAVVLVALYRHPLRGRRGDDGPLAYARQATDGGLLFSRARREHQSGARAARVEEGQ